MSLLQAARAVDCSAAPFESSYPRAVELLFYAAVFYLWQCVVFLPAGGCAFLSTFGVVRVRGAPGLRLMSPWPGSLGLALGGLPLVITRHRAFSDSPLRMFAPTLTWERELDLQGAPRLEARGANVVGHGRRFLRTVSAAHALFLSSLLSRLSGLERSQRKQALEAALDQAFDARRLGETLTAARRETLPLRWGCNAYAVLVFLALPLQWLRRDTESAWWAMLPLIAAVHVVCWTALLLTTLRTDSLSGSGERLFTSAVFPPTLLRAPFEMVNDRLASFHPAAAAAVLLEGQRRDRFFRTLIADLERPSWERHEGWETTAEAERRHYLAALRSRSERLANQAGVEWKKTSADPTAEAYCPLCLGDFSSNGGRCADCGVDTLAYVRS